jgi:membrane protein YqaA with SNARE-associated domain
MNKIKASLLAWGIPGLFLFALLDGAGLPIPGGLDFAVVLLATEMPERYLWLAAVAVVGSTIGNFILFSIARKGGEMYLAKHTMSKAGQRFRGWFRHYGLLTVFIAALVPLPVMPMKAFVLCAGALGSSRRAFVSVFVLARIVRYLSLARLGAEMGDHAWTYLRDHKFLLLGIAVGLFFFLYGLVKIADRRRLRQASPEVPALSPNSES